jgi:hypothetical protein
MRADRQGRRWEVHHDPDDLSHVFVRDYRNRGRLSAAWTHLPMVGAPFADLASRAAREIVTQRGGATPRSSGPGQPDHLNRHGPDGDTQQRRVATRNRAAARSVLPAPDDDAEEIEMEDDTRGDVPGDFVRGLRGRR